MYVTPELELTTDGELSHLTKGEHVIELKSGDGPALLNSLRFSIAMQSDIFEIRQGSMDGELIELTKTEQAALCDVLTEVERIAAEESGL